MEKMDDKDCQKLFDETCRQKVAGIYSEVEDLIDKAADGSEKMQTAIKSGLAGRLLEGAVPIVFEMASVVLPGRKEIDLWRMIVDGKKIIDIRALTPQYQAVRVGDVVCFRRSDSAQVLRRVGLICTAAGLTDLIKKIVDSDVFGGNEKAKLQSTLRAIIPDVPDFQTLSRAIYAFSDYEAKIAEYGVVAFVLMPLAAEKFETGPDAEMARMGWTKEIHHGVEVFTRPA